MPLCMFRNFNLFVKYIMSKTGNYMPCIPRFFGSDCEKGLGCKPLTFIEKMSMSNEDRRTGYVCKGSNKYMKFRGRIIREREREEEEERKYLLGQNQKQTGGKKTRRNRVKNTKKIKRKNRKRNAGRTNRRNM